MAKYLANCEVESHLCLADELSVLKYHHPRGRYDVFLRNLQTQPGSEIPLLSAKIVFEAPSINEAKAIAEENLKEFLDYLTVATDGKYRLHHISQVFDWERDSPTMRDAIYFEKFRNHDVPIPALNPEVLKTLSVLQGADISSLMRRALKWFGNGVAARYNDDQFTYFWFVVEVLARVNKSTDLVPDKCSKCQSPLYCPECKATPHHRPYTKQAIEQLFARHVRDDWKAFYDLASGVRNRLLHGDEVTAIEDALRVKLSTVVDNLGRLAWVAILAQFSDSTGNVRLSFLQTNRYVHATMSTSAVIKVGFKPDFEEPYLTQFPKITMTIERSSKSEK